MFRTCLEFFSNELPSRYLHPLKASLLFQDKKDLKLKVFEAQKKLN